MSQNTRTLGCEGDVRLFIIPGAPGSRGSYQNSPCLFPRNRPEFSVASGTDAVLHLLSLYQITSRVTSHLQLFKQRVNLSSTPSGQRGSSGLSRAHWGSGQR